MQTFMYVSFSSDCFSIVDAPNVEADDEVDTVLVCLRFMQYVTRNQTAASQNQNAPMKSGLGGVKDYGA